MQIFYLDADPAKAARMLGNKHVSKMALEGLQILCTAWPSKQPIEGVTPYKPTHVNHPTVRWAKASSRHRLWLLQHVRALLNEHACRYYVLPSEQKMRPLLEALEAAFVLDETDVFYPPALCAKLDIDSTENEVVKQFRKIYTTEKAHLCIYFDDTIIPSFITKPLIVHRSSIVKRRKKKHHY